MLVPRKGQYVVGNEPAIQAIFVLTAGDALNQLFDDAVQTSEYATSRESIGEGLRTPDLISIRLCGTTLTDNRLEDLGENLESLGADLGDNFVFNSKQFQGDKNIPVLAGEFKRDYFATGEKLKGDTLDLVARYNAGENMAVCAIHQLSGYNYHYKCKFGLISTYGYTWVSWMDNSGTLFISPASSSVTSGIDSTLNQLYFVICLAVNQLGDGSNLWNPPDLKVPDNAKDREKQLDGLRGGYGIQFLRCMVKHEDRISWQCRYDGSTDLILVKAFNKKADRDLEVACYNSLKSLQGVAIPILRDADYQYFNQEYQYGLILSWVGAEFGGNFLVLPRSALLEAQKIVAVMHANGVVHRDLRPENMNYNFTTGKLFLYDFSHAATRTSISAEEFEDAREEDVCALEEYIKISESPAAVEEIKWAADWVRREEGGAAAMVEGRLLR